ncbi:hypothetical protein POTOM_038101 [Populus tomentosa]|uniref:Uncharacterized protein n=1 Tax=Populus tomentosa TaxID=118781 RepID=A0A8X8CD65_POPTO|nr:hypothetical protein POTOM_038101 [Populus tomentosa]
MAYFCCYFYCDYSKPLRQLLHSQVCAPCHTWAVKTAVYAGMHALPTRDQLLLNPYETGELVSIVIKCLALVYAV